MVCLFVCLCTSRVESSRVESSRFRPEGQSTGGGSLLGLRCTKESERVVEMKGDERRTTSGHGRSLLFLPLLFCSSLCLFFFFIPFSSSSVYQSITHTADKLSSQHLAAG